MTKTALQKRLIAALDKDNSVLIDRSTLSTAKGYSEAYMLELGLRKSDLKKLETLGLAIRGISVFTGPMRQKVTQTAWVLLAEGSTNEKRETNEVN